MIYERGKGSLPPVLLKKWWWTKYTIVKMWNLHKKPKKLFWNWPKKVEKGQKYGTFLQLCYCASQEFLCSTCQSGATWSYDHVSFTHGQKACKDLISYSLVFFTKNQFLGQKNDFEISFKKKRTILPVLKGYKMTCTLVHWLEQISIDFHEFSIKLSWLWNLKEL